MTAMSRDPFTLPEWRALHRETMLVSQLIGAGATALSNASYANGLGQYYTAFFSLSIGLERLAKLVIVADHLLKSNGSFLQSTILRSIGHDISRLIEKVDEISKERNLNITFRRPSSEIVQAILRCLSAFAEASKGRYANFEAIGNPNFNAAEEPVEKWWREVVELILEKHYRGKAAEAGVKCRARIIDELMAPMSYVHYMDESGRTMSDVVTASERTGQTRYAQKYGRFYVLSIVRWMMDVFRTLTFNAGYRAGFEVLFGHEEIFATYVNDDEFLLTRKRWPL